MVMIAAAVLFAGVAAQAAPSPQIASALQEVRESAAQRYTMPVSETSRGVIIALHSRETEILNAAVKAARTDGELLEVHSTAMVTGHPDVGLDAATVARQRATAPVAWHHLGAATAALDMALAESGPRRAELLTQADAAIAKALPLDASGRTWLLAGRIYDAMFEWTRAKSAFDLALKVRVPADVLPQVYRGMWRSHSALGQMPDADRWFAEYEKTGAATDQDYHDRANHLGSIERFSESAAMFTRLARKPDQAIAPAYKLWYSAVWAHWKAREDRAAIEAARATVQATPDEPEARRVAAMAVTIAASILVERGDLKGGLEFANLAISADASFPSSYTQIAKVHLAEKRPAEAEREARRALQLAPPNSDAEAQIVLGQALGAQGRWAEAAAGFEAGAYIDKAHAYAAFNAAIAYENAGRAADAIRWYEETLRRNPAIRERDRILADIARLKTPRLG